MALFFLLYLCPTLSHVPAPPSSDCGRARKWRRMWVSAHSCGWQPAAQPVEAQLMGAVRNVNFSFVPCLQDGGPDAFRSPFQSGTVRLTDWTSPIRILID